MKKRFIPATVAALALTFSAVAVPQAVAQPLEATERSVGFDQLDGQTVELAAGSPVVYQITGIDEDATVSVTGLPAGLTFDPETNTVSGVPTIPSPAGSSSSVVITVTSFEGEDPDTATVTVTVTADVVSPAITALGDAAGEVNTAIDPIDIVVSEAATVTVEGLPAGLEYDADAGSDGANGAIVGTPTEATPTGAPANVTVNATDAAGNDAEETFNFTVKVDTTVPEIETLEDETGEVNTAIDPIDIVVSEAATVTVEGLPAGLEYDANAGSEGANGAIVGTPTEATPTGNPANVTVNATDAAGNKAVEETFEFTVGPDVTDPRIENPGTQRFVVDEAIDPLEIQVNELAAVTVEGLPAGLSFNDDDLVISGTPTAVSENPVTVTIRAVDEAGNSSTETFTATVVEADDNGRSSIGSAEGSSADDINWGLVGVGGVLAALIGVIAAIGGGFIQLPPAIANLIPFL